MSRISLILRQSLSPLTKDKPKTIKSEIEKTSLLLKLVYRLLVCVLTKCFLMNNIDLMTDFTSEKPLLVVRLGTGTNPKYGSH